MLRAGLALVGAVALVGLSIGAQAAPVTPMHAPASGLTSGLIKVRGGCGPGYAPEFWRDAWGYPHRRCVPEYYAPPPPPRYDWPERRYEWREPRPDWGWRY